MNFNKDFQFINKPKIPDFNKTEQLLKRIDAFLETANNDDLTEESNIENCNEDETYINMDIYYREDDRNQSLVFPEIYENMINEYSSDDDTDSDEQFENIIDESNDGNCKSDDIGENVELYLPNGGKIYKQNNRVQIIEPEIIDETEENKNIEPTKD